MTDNTTTDNTSSLPAVTDAAAPTAAALAPVETLEFSEKEMSGLMNAIEYADQQDTQKMTAVRVDAVYLEMKKDESLDLMVAGYAWRKSEFGEGEVLSVNFYDLKEKCFRYAMQTALVGKIREAKMPKGQIVRVTYLGKTKGKKYQYNDYKIEALVPAKTTKEPTEEEPKGKK